MASIELTTLQQHFDADEIKALEVALSEAGSSPLDIDRDAETVLLERDVDDDLLADILDRLDVNDAACEVYVPPDFDQVFEIGDARVGSAHALLLALAELAEDLGEDEDEDEEEFEETEEDDEYEEDGGSDYNDPSYDMRDEGLRRVCQLLQQGARMAIRKGLAMYLHHN